VTEVISENWFSQSWEILHQVEDRQ